MATTENPGMTKAYIDRVRPGRPHTDDVVRTIEGLAEVRNRLVAQSRKLDAGGNLTTVGRASKLAELARGELAKEYAKASRRARIAPSYIQAQRACLDLPKADKMDLSGTMRRLELRTFLRDLPPKERYAKASEFADDPELAVALFEMPAAVSGLDDESLKMPNAEVFKGLRKNVLQKLHGPRLAELNEQADDYAAASGMASVVRHDLFKVSGLSQEGFEAVMRPLEVEADK